MRPRYAKVVDAYPRRDPFDRPTLLGSIGWDDLIANMNFENTCAIRVSIALVAAGMRLPGRMSVKAGPLRGRLVEPGQVKLCHILAKPNMLGAPEKFQGAAAAEAGIRMRGGIVFFWRIYPERRGATQGHIDVIGPNAYQFLACLSNCYFGAFEVWFWPLK